MSYQPARIVSLLSLLLQPKNTFFWETSSLSMSPVLFLPFFYLFTFTFAVPSPAPGYGPKPTICPSTPLVRPATGISIPESEYISARTFIASAALRKWLQRVNPSFSITDLPTVALTTSGGGPRSLLTGAGVIQALDDRDSSAATSGLYQGLTYQAGLSGGSMLLSSLAGNNYPTISWLKKNLWSVAFAGTLLELKEPGAGAAYQQIRADMTAKSVAGYQPTLVDAYGRLLSYQLLHNAKAGACDELSEVTTLSSFVTKSVPLPIITSLNVETATGTCMPSNNSIIYELSPYEFGSFDSGVNAFIQTKYLGTSLSNGKPKRLICQTNFDNIGFIMATSSDVFNELCNTFPGTVSLPAGLPADLSSLPAILSSLINQTHHLTSLDEYANYPNPFYQYTHSSLITNQKTLALVDGGESHQNNPLFPFLQPVRGIDVILVNDNSADTAANFPDGSHLYQTYIQAQQADLTKMPAIPRSSVFLSKGYNIRPTFFGCNDNDKVTIIYLPNHNYTFQSGQSTFKLQYTPAETHGMIKNGGQVATFGGNATFPTCLGCTIVKKTSIALPGVCQKCFEDFCYN